MEVKFHIRKVKDKTVTPILTSYDDIVVELRGDKDLVNKMKKEIEEVCEKEKLEIY